jgi:SAM-dependent methyltransferase
MKPDPREAAAAAAWSYLTDAEQTERHLQRNFSSIADVHGFHNHLVTGDASRSYLEYFHSKYIGADRAVDAISLGSGNGHLERTILGLGWKFTSLFGLELNPTLVEFAQAEVASLPASSRVKYRVANLNRLSLDPVSADLAIFFHSLHHVEALRPCLEEVSRALRIGGTLLVVDYFGGNRLQRSPDHLALCDVLLKRMPEVYRIDLLRSSKSEIVLKERCENLPIDEVIQRDPSEAVRSEDAEESLRSAPGLVLVEEKPLGGTILDPLFLNIAGNFRPDDDVARAYVRMAISAEEVLLQSKGMRSDYRFMVLRKVSSRQRWLTSLRRRFARAAPPHP